MNKNRKVSNNDYDELSELEKYMDTFNSQTPSFRKNSIQQKKQSGPQQAKKYEECPECDLKFQHLRDLTKHFSEVHEEDSEEDGEDELSKIASFLNSNPRNNPKLGQGSVLSKNIPERIPQTLDGISRTPTIHSHSISSIENSCSPQAQGSKSTNKFTPIPLGNQSCKTQVKMIKESLNQSIVKSRENLTINPRGPGSEQITQSRVPTPRQSYNQPTFVTRPIVQTLTSAGNYKTSKPLAKNSPKVASAKPQVEVDSKEKLAEQYRMQIQRRIDLNVKNHSLGAKAKAQDTRSSEINKAQTKSTSSIAPTVTRRPVLSSPAPSPLMNRSQISGAVAGVHFQAKKTRPPPPIPKVNFIPDTVPTIIQDVGTAVVPASSTDPFLNSFFAFFHSKVPEQPPEQSQEVRPITYDRPDPSEASGDVNDFMSGDEDIEEVPDTDPLLDHIASSGLPLQLRRPTLSDGNCWWDATADQVVLHNIPDIPREHGSLRKAVVDSLMTLPQTPIWIENFFGNSKKNFRKFMARHRKLGTWTDNLGIMCQATALYLGRHIHIVGTANMGQEQSFTKLEAGDKADKLSPIYIGYYQDKHYQSLEYIGKPEPLTIEAESKYPENMSTDNVKVLEEPGKVILMDDVIDLILIKALEEASVRTFKPKKKCKVIPIKPFKEPPKSAEELEREKIQNDKIDSMLGVLDKRMSLKSNDHRLEIFQNLQRLDTIMEFYQVCQGGVQGVQKTSQEQEAPEAEEPVIKEVPTEAKKKDLKEEEKKTSTEQTTHILDVFKCNKCNHAFEKINLFVKHFIKVHKDVIDANKNSSSFSFSNFWTKMKVRASVKKKDKEDEEKKTEVLKLEENQKIEELPKKPIQELSIIDELTSLKLFKVKKLQHSSLTKKDVTDLEMVCESQPFIVKRRMCMDEGDQIEENHNSISVSDFYNRNLKPEDFQSSIFLSEGEPSIGDVVSKADLEVTDKYQMIPLSEIKLENPFEDLPFTWKYDDYVPEASKTPLRDITEISHEDTALGITSEAEIAALEIVAYVLNQMESILSDIYKDEDVEEVFQEEFHDKSNTNISHQIYIKDFDWIPLEDQFTECPDHEQADIAKLFSIKKLRKDEDKLTSIKMLLHNTDNDHVAMKSYIAKIVGRRFVPQEANHKETVPAKAKYIRFDHNYLPSNKSRKLAMLKPPSNVVMTLKRMRSKVDIFPSAGQDLKKPSFVGKRPPRRIINNNLLIHSNRAKSDVKPNVINVPMSRGRIQIIPQGKENEAPPEYLDKFLRRLHGEPDSPEMLDPPPFVDETAPTEPETDPSEENIADIKTTNFEDFALTSKTSAKDKEDYLPLVFEESLVDESSTAEAHEGEISSGPETQSPRSISPSCKRKRKQESNLENQTASKKKHNSKSLGKLSSSEEVATEDAMEQKLASQNEEIFIPPSSCQSDMSDAPSPTSKQGPVIISESSLMDHSASMEDAWKDIDEFLDSSTGKNISVTASSVPSDHDYDSQLNDHLDSLREPVGVESQKASGPPESTKSVSSDIINDVEEMPDPSSYCIKQEPLESPPLLIDSEVCNVPPGPGSYSIKLESSRTGKSSSAIVNPDPIIDIKQEMDTYGLFGQTLTFPIKSEAVKSEPLDFVVNEDDEEIQIIDNINVKEKINKDLVDVIINVLRCKECFKSFISKEDLDCHIKTHSEKDEFDENKWLTDSKEKQISSSRLPFINVRRESTKDHGYIYPRKQTPKAKNVESADYMIVSQAEKEKSSRDEKPPAAEKNVEENLEDPKCMPKNEGITENKKAPKADDNKVEDSVEKLTVLQALDTLFQPSKSQSPKPPVVQPAQSALQALDTLLQSSKLLMNEQKVSQVKTNKAAKHPKRKTSIKADNEATMKTLIKKKEAKSTLTCQVCWKVTCATMESMRKHLTFHPHTQCKGKVNICYICDDKFDLRDEEYTIHVEGHLLEMRTSGYNQCLGCQENFSNSDQLMRHVQTVHEKGKRFPCSICPEKFDRKKKLLLHLDTIHSEVQIE